MIAQRSLAGIGILSLLLCLPKGAFAEDAGALQPPSVAHIHMTEESIRDKVKVYRMERYDQMPYLNRGFVRSEITEKKVRERDLFSGIAEKSLSEVIERAAEVHTPVRSAGERINLARRRIISAVRNLFPEANFELGQRDGSLATGAFSATSWRHSFRQPLFRGGMLWNTLLQEKMGLEAAEKEYDAVVGELIKDVATAYFEYSRTYQAIKEQAIAIEKMKPFAKISQQKFDEQIISEIEHLNTQSLYSQMQYDYETSKQEHEIAKLNLQRFVDLSPSEPLEIKPVYDLENLLNDEKAFEQETLKIGDIRKDEFGEEVKQLDVAELIDLAYEHRPELQVEAAKLQSARLAERVRWGQMVPHADVVLEFGKLGEGLMDLTLDPKRQKEFRFVLEVNWNVGGSKIGYTAENDERAPSVSSFAGGEGTATTRNTFNVNLLDGLSDLISIKEAEVSRLEQIAELENAEKEVIQDVKQSYFDFEKAKIQVKSTLQRTNYRQRLRNLAEHRLQNNEIQISEYMQSEIDLLQELTALHKALADYYTAKAKLNHAIGMRNYMPLEE